GIPQTTKIRAAANPPEWGGGDGISDAMRSRFAVIEHEVSMPHLIDFWQKRYHDSPKTLKKQKEIIDVAGQYGIVHSQGEGHQRRITCPRTITMALDAYMAGCAPQIIPGLLTTPFAILFSRSEH